MCGHTLGAGLAREVAAGGADAALGNPCLGLYIPYGGLNPGKLPTAASTVAKMSIESRLSANRHRL